MARISSYTKDTTVQDNDAWVGTASPNRQTKNFLASDVAKYLNIKGKISISAQMVYEFKSDPNEAGTGDFYGVSDNTDFSTITSLNISATDKGNQNVVNFITYLVDSDILISEQKNISSFGHYKITAYTDNGDGFYTLTLSYLGGGGSVGNKKFYDIANFSIAKLGDITAVNAGTYLNGGGSSGDVTLNHDLTSRTNTTSSVTPGYGGTFTAIDSVVTNTTGHITTVNTKTVTIPDSGVDGNGTTNYVAKWLDTDTIQNSIIFDNGTNVGIGTNNPTKNLEIGTNAAAETEFRMHSDESSRYFNIQSAGNFTSLKTAGSQNFILESSGTAGYVTFKAGNSERMRVNYNGNVGIGTTNPSSPLTFGKSVYGGFDSENFYRIKLQDQGGTHNDVGIGQTASGNMGFNITSGNAFIFNNGTSGEIARFNGTGLGIGTASPSQELHVSGNARVTGAYYDSNNTPGTSGQVLSSTVTGTDWVSLSEIQGVDGTGTANYVAKWSDSDTITDSVIYDDGTNVGIGTTSPTQKLQVEGNIYTGGSIRIEDNGDQLEFGNANVALQRNSNFLELGGYDGIIFRSSNATLDNQSERMRITSSGNVLVNKTSSTGDILQVQGNNNVFPLRLDGSSTVGQSYGLRVRAGTNSVDKSMLVENTGGTDLFLVRGDGNVGIGTSSPSEKLDVAGVARFDTGVTEGVHYVGTSLEHWGDGGTGVSFPANDTISLKTSSSDRVYITSNGNVGIGTTSPTAPLTVKSNSVSSQSSGIVLQANGSTDDIIRMGEKSTNGGRLHMLDGGVEKIAFYTDGTDNHISAGNVGIGTTSPGRKLEVDFRGSVYGAKFTRSDATGSSLIEFANSAGVKSIIGYDAGVDGSIIGTTSATNLVVKQSGNVGIGTTNPGHKLDVDGDVNIPFGTSNGYRINGNRILSQGSGVFEFGALDYKSTYPNISTNSDGTFRIQSNGSTLVTVNQSSNVGIGTTSPGAKLDVNGNISIAHASGSTASNYISMVGSRAIFGYDGSISSAFMRSSDTSKPLVFGSGTSEFMRIVSSNGNVGIGTTSPSEKLHVSSSGDTILRVTSADGNAAFLDLGDASDPDGGRIVYDSGSNLALYTASSERMRIKSNGRVGIATTNPQSQLQINGGDGLTVTANDAAYSAGYFGRIQSDYGINALRLVSRAGDVFRATNYGQDVAILTGTTTTGTSERMRINASGNVGIGTTTPSSKLDVVGYIKSSNNLTGLTNKYGKFLGTHYNISEQDVLGLAIESTSSSNNILIGGGFSSNNTATTIKFFTAANSTTTTGSEKMRISSTGNVGIGTTSPLTKLDILGTSDTYVTIRNTGGGNKAGILMYGGSAGISHIWHDDIETNPPGIHFGTSANVATAPTTQMYIEGSSGNVGIGTTSPSEKLHVNGNGLFNGGLTVGDSAADTFITRGHTYLATTGNNVGIGTTSPQSKLQVAGGVQMADDTDAASADKVGTLRYRTSGNNSYVDMCMQTGATTYEWVNIVQNNW